MRTETEVPSLRLANFHPTSGYLEQSTPESWDRLVQSEMTLRGRTTRPIDTRVTMVGVILSSISAMTLVLTEIYRHLDAAITGQLQPATSLQSYVLAGIIAGLAIGVAGRFAPVNARNASRLSGHRGR